MLEHTVVQQIVENCQKCVVILQYNKI